jgi:hypothetical protein
LKRRPGPFPAGVSFLAAISEGLVCAIVERDGVRHYSLAITRRAKSSASRHLAALPVANVSSCNPSGARAVGFVNSWSRLSAALSGLVVAYLLGLGGVNAVFSFIAFAMVIVVVSIGAFGPRTRGLAREAISHA